MNKDMDDVYEFYVRSLMDRIGELHTHVDMAELRSIWRDIKRPVRRRRTRPQRDSLSEYEKRKRQLEGMRYEDLCRHCVRNGLQPPNNRDDMIKIILTRGVS